MSKEMVTAGVVGLVLLVVAFYLFIPLNRATGNLYQFFVNGCKEGNSYFAKTYAGVATLSQTRQAAAVQYDTTNDVFGGRGKKLTNNSGGCQRPAFTLTELNLPASVPDQGATAGPQPYQTIIVYNEQGDQVANMVVNYTGDSETATADPLVAPGAANLIVADGYRWYQPADLLGDFIGVIRVLVSLSPIIVVAGFLTLASIGLIKYGMGTGQGGLSGAISGAVGSLILNIVVMYLSPIGMSAVVEAGATTQTGALAVNEEFSGIQRLLFSVIPLIMIATVIGSPVLAGGLQYGGWGGKMKGMMGGNRAMAV